MVTLHSLLEHLAANTWVILKVAIISFFKSKLLTLCSGISFIEFRQKCVYNPPPLHTHDIHVLAAHVEMSLFMVIKLNLSLSLPCLTF